MCEYLRPVVALEWLKACCTDMITWMSSFSYEETLNTMTARNYQSWRCGRYGTVTSHEITNASVVTKLLAYKLYAVRVVVCTVMQSESV